MAWFGDVKAHSAAANKAWKTKRANKKAAEAKKAAAIAKAKRTRAANQKVEQAQAL